MDFNTGQPQTFTPAQLSRNSFLMASLICAILSLMSSCFILGTMFFSALAILFAVLSKGKELKMHIMGKSCVFVAACSLAFSLLLTTISVYSVMSDPQTRQEFYDQYEQMTGTSFEDDLNQITQLYQ